MKKLKGWRTRLFSALVALYGAIELVDPHLIADALGVDTQGRAIIIISIAVGMYVLRQVTTTAPGRAE
ncbi:hypothetical protein [uncultured Maritalea sp.]|uniref:hypothetical protein n=1 Tax=uncultured Maritalea sp. TaxID=757249 RepID=UPI00260BBAB5|nr:hypothetical protein [uncultured Maritalea sp.]